MAMSLLKKVIVCLTKESVSGYLKKTTYICLAPDILKYLRKVSKNENNFQNVVLVTLGVGSAVQSPMCDVVWDKPFLGASPLDGLCPDRRGYRIPQYCLLNLNKYKIFSVNILQ